MAGEIGSDGIIEIIAEPITATNVVLVTAWGAYGPETVLRVLEPGAPAPEGAGFPFGVVDGVRAARLVADGLAEWEQAWLSAGGAPASMLAVLLADAPVAFVSDRRDGRIAAGAVVHRGTGVLGLSNVFEAPDSSDESGASDGAGWRAAASAASWLAPELGVVGYERDAWLSTALTIGFRPVGPLIIWQRG